MIHRAMWLGRPDDPEHAAQAYLGRLTKTTGQWLVVPDDLTTPVGMDGLWPPSSVSGRTVVTTRSREQALIGSGRRLVQVGMFTPEHAHTYLADKFAEHPHRLAGADDLARDAGLLPLTLAEAAAFIAAQNLTCAEYRHLLAQARTLVQVLPHEQGS